MQKLNLGKRACAVLVLCAAAAIALPAQTFRALHSFDGTDGSYPTATLVQATDGNLYGTTYYGGTNGMGTVFKFAPNGTLTTLYSFCSQSSCTDGTYPQAGLVQGSDGNLYGTTFEGGTSGEDCVGDGLGCGTVFKITPTGTLTTLYRFCSQSGCPDGAVPYAALIQASDGYFYGTTGDGGANGAGTVFKITSSGTLTTLYSFCAQSDCTDGAGPFSALVQATDGNFYGTTGGGGAYDQGTVFKLTPRGTLTTLYSFSSETAGVSTLIQATDGNFYGTTYFGGSNGAGTVFKITPSGTLTTLYSFCWQGGQCFGYGQYPVAGLMQATDGNFYGTTSESDYQEYGTIFEITPSGTLTTLYSSCAFVGCPTYPLAGLAQDTNGKFYGTMATGGAYGGGTIFSLDNGLGPFVETQPTFGKAGKLIKILGTNLTGATSVTFNGTPAVFKVISHSLIGATVPAGATTGTVQVTTPSGTLSSNVLFHVKP